MHTLKGLWIWNINGAWCKDGTINRTKVCVILWEETFQYWTDIVFCVIASTYIKNLIRNHSKRTFFALPIFSSVISVLPKKKKQNTKEFITLKTTLACSLQGSSLCTKSTFGVTSSKSINWWQDINHISTHVIY